MVPASGGATDRQIMIMKDFKVTACCATPSYFIHMMERASEMGIDVRALPLRVGGFGAELDVLLHPLGRVRPQVDDPVACLAAHEQGQVLALLQQIIDIGAMDLNRAQGLQRHHADHEQIAQPADLLVAAGLLRIGDRRKQTGQFLVA